MLVIDARDIGDPACLRYNRLSYAPISSSWTRSEAPEPKIHHIHAYPARFPAFLVHKAFDYARHRGVDVKRVADVFCGSGTVAYEAAAKDIEFWGCDINPVATMIARVKTLRLDPRLFLELAQNIIEKFDRACSTPSLSLTARMRLLLWYEASQFTDLAKLQNAILSEVGNENDEALALTCAFSAILKSSSQWRARSTKPSKDLAKQPTSVLEAFRKQCHMMAAAWTEVATSPRPRSRILLGNVNQVQHPDIPVDLIITSPPYATSYEYADLHQLSALWLGFADDHRDLRSGSIGTSSSRADLAKAMRELNPVGMQIVFSLFDRNRAMAEATASYFLDMQRVAKRCHEFLRPGGISVFVIGNTECQGIRIDSANHLVESLLEAGFVDVRVVKRQLANKPNTPYRSPDGRLSSAPTRTRIYAEEYILMAQRR